MRELKKIPAISKHSSLYLAAIDLNVGYNTLVRRVNLGALVDDKGQVWIKTGKPIKELAK